eukprot:TRINITY_DN5521_c0_g2_i2.p1 TRINITY_DN5521_c0_g2~~TRINITY_DN5521_c0_g2_i2.p1  ORF type:complete len:247 (+),score=19.52 TRINITY_DN5521_c0_g2_i2:64-804(+)
MPGINAAAENNAAIVSAAIHGDVALVKRLLQIPAVTQLLRDSALTSEGLGRSHPPSSAHSAMLEAIHYGHLAVVECLLTVPEMALTLRDESMLVYQDVVIEPTILARLITVPGINTGGVMTQAIKYGLWQLMEVLLCHRETVMALELDPSTLRSPMARHVKAVQLCVNRVGDEFISEAYPVGYGVVRGEGKLPVGVSELVCECVVESRGLAQWTVHVHRQLRKELEKLSGVAKLRSSSCLQQQSTS